MRHSPPKVSYIHFNTAGSWLFAKYGFALKSAGAEVEIACLDQPHGQVVAGYYDQLVPTRVFGYSASIRSGLKSVKELQRMRGRLVRRFAIRRLKRHLEDSNPTHLIAGDPFALDVCVPLAQRLRVKLIYIPFEFYPKHVGANFRQAAKFEACERRYIEKASAIVFLGDSIFSYYTKKYPRIATRSHVVYSSWPAGQAEVNLRLRKDAQVGPDKKIVLYQGIIEIDRGLANVVGALRNLPANTLFVVLGYGSACGALEQRAADLRVHDRLLILPPVPQAKLMSYTKDADVGIIPLLNVKSHYYACPGKLFEYIGAELPLVVSDMPDLKRIVQKYGLGEVYPSDSVEHLTSALSKLLSNDGHRKQCAANCRQAQLEVLCWEKQSALLCEIVFSASVICAPS